MQQAATSVTANSGSQSTFSEPAGGASDPAAGAPSVAPKVSAMSTPAIRFAADEMMIELSDVGVSQLVTAADLFDEGAEKQDDSNGSHASGGDEHMSSGAMEDGRANASSEADSSFHSGKGSPQFERDNLSEPTQFNSLAEPSRRIISRNSLTINNALFGSLAAGARRASQLGSLAADARRVSMSESPTQALLLRSPIQCINMSLAQGRMYALVGGSSSGKSTLLRLLGKSVHPTTGEVFVPPHLSVVHVEYEPQLFRHMSLYDNLTLGFKLGIDPPPIEQICSVCQALGLATRWIDHLKNEHEQIQRRKKTSRPRHLIKDSAVASNVDVGGDVVVHSGWQDLLSATDKHCIHLVRALVTNPHVLVLHRPLASLDEDVAEQVLKALRRFIARRSLFTDSKPSN